MHTLLDRPVVRRLLTETPRDDKRLQVSAAMLKSARELLKSLSNRGTREKDSARMFKSIVDALVPADAKENQCISTIGDLLGLSHDQVMQSRKRTREAESMGGSGRDRSQVVNAPRAKRCDYIREGRQICDQWWHANTRMDTNPRKKKRIRIGVNKYKEHWRHVQYETDEQMARAFFKGPEYAAYLDRGGKAFQEDIKSADQMYSLEIGQNQTYSL